MKQAYLIWNLTNYGDGFEMLGAYPTRAKAEKAYRAEMKKRYGTTDEDKLFDLWNDDETGCVDGWRITPIEIKD